MNLYPLRFKPVYKDYLWGGDNIPRRYGRDVPPGIYAESWEISTHPDGMSCVANGELSGRSLQDVVHLWGAHLLGQDIEGERFPLLIKLIDARRRLSVQVHPNDGNAGLTGGEPKTEMWYVLDAEPGAKVYAGLHKGANPEQFSRAIEKEQLESLLQEIAVKKGDAVFIPGGRVHAIAEGCLLLEVQQNSNTTYRIYDWGRKGPDGKPRELHVEKALQVIDWADKGDPRISPREMMVVGGTRLQEILWSRYFCMQQMELDAETEVETDGGSFTALFFAEGTCSLQWAGGCEQCHAGDSVLIPASLRNYELRPTSTKVAIIKICVP